MGTSCNVRTTALLTGLWGAGWVASFIATVALNRSGLPVRRYDSTDVIPLLAVMVIAAGAGASAVSALVLRRLSALALTILTIATLGCVTGQLRYMVSPHRGLKLTPSIIIGSYAVVIGGFFLLTAAVGWLVRRTSSWLTRSAVSGPLSLTLVLFMIEPSNRVLPSVGLWDLASLVCAGTFLAVPGNPPLDLIRND